LQKDFRDPLFVFDGSDDGKGHGVTRMLRHATILVTIPLPPTVRLAEDQSTRSVVMQRGIPSTLNTPALDPVLMLDGRDPDLPTQAAHAVERHAQAAAPSVRDLRRIAEFEKSEPFFSSGTLRKYAQGGDPPTLPAGRTASEKRGRRFFIDADITLGDHKTGACAVCHSGPMLNQTNRFLPLPVAPGTRFLSANVSERNVLHNPVLHFLFRNPDGTETSLWSPDPGRSLISGRIDGDMVTDGPHVFTSLNAFKIPTLWGVKDTAPYFHDNSARTLEEMVDHYADFVFKTLPPQFGFESTAQDRADIVAYIKLLE
jgi:cytochrome c peroxidase